MKKNRKSRSTYRTYSESFKLQIIAELEKGESTKEDLKRRYGLGNETIHRWLVKYKRIDLMTRRVRIEKPEEVDQLKAMKARIAELEKALVEVQLNHLKDASLLKCAMDDLGQTKEVYEKKRGAKLSKKP